MDLFFKLLSAKSRLTRVWTLYADSVNALLVTVVTQDYSSRVKYEYINHVYSVVMNIPKLSDTLP